MSNHDREGSPPSNGDAALEHAWRDASNEQPPSHLDAAIIAAARKSVPVQADPPKTAPVRVQSRNWLLQWQPLAAAAGVVGLAFVLVQMLPREHDLAPMMQHKASSPSAPAATDNRQAPVADKSVARTERVAVPDRAPAQSPVSAPAAILAPPAATAEATANETAATADAAAASRETSADRREAVEPEMAGRAAAAAAPSSSAREQDLGKAALLDAAGWAEKITALHRSGDVTAATDALRAFRAADPDADTYLPDSLREWARTVE
jgi:cytoskeletal protein RodZ